MVRNIKMKTFLVFSFALVLTFMSLLGAMSFYHIRRLANLTMNFYENPHTVQMKVGEIQLIISEVGSALKETMVERNLEQQKTAEKNIDARLDAMMSSISIVKERFEGDEQLIVAADAAVAKWIEAVQYMQKLMKENKYNQALREFDNTYIVYEDAASEAVDKISEGAHESVLEYYQSAKRSKIISLIVISGIVLFTIILTILICIRIVRSIMVPLRSIKNAAESMAKGDLSQKIDFQGKNEFGQLAKSMEDTTFILSNYIKNIDGVLEKLSKNDMTAKITMEYMGDFKSIQYSLEHITLSLNKTMSQIGECSLQVTGSANLMSESAQMISQGAMEQANSIDQLSANMNEISSSVHQNAIDTKDANLLVSDVSIRLEEGNKQMTYMLNAMAEINRCSDQIAKIIKAIEDIAFQTNILALNAAVEAARAGEAGKGFAVVADEVRNLASKSAEAAKSTTQLIEDSIKAVENGTQIADETAKTIHSVVDGTKKIHDMVARISSASEEQSNTLEQVAEAVGSISQVVQSNSAASEESAATSQALSNQAQFLQSMLSKFKLK